MSKDIRVKKGLNIRLKGEAQEKISEASRSKTYVIRPSDFHLITPKMVVKEGAKLIAGDVIFHSKDNASIKFLSPVSGTLSEIKRGERRVITALVIEADKEDTYVDFGKVDSEKMDASAIKQHLLDSGCWPFIKQRPYDVIANPDASPKAIFISGHASAPLAANYNFTLAGKEAELQAAVNALGKLTDGKVHVSVGQDAISALSNVQGITLHKVSGPHPSGNVGTLINKIDPVNKGEVVWTITPQDLVIIGELLLTGKFNAERVVALAGSSVENPQYFSCKIGAEASSLTDQAKLNETNVRVISGNVLSGTSIGADGHLGYYNNTITVIPEGDDYELFGWNKPVFNKVSTSRALTFSWLFPKKEYALNTNTNGEHRAFVVTGNYGEVFPLDIIPMRILKACMVQDLDEMEQLGMYEVAPEDFALTEFVCVSKQPHQDIIRKGLDLMYKEIG